MFGPEPWRDGWSYWDLWYAVVCVADHGGDLDALEVAVAAADRGGSDREAKWSHLCDLRGRLASAGLDASGLAGDLAADPAVRRRAREKVLRSHLYERDLTEAMRDLPSTRLRARSLHGWWPRFPVSPQRAYNRLAAMTGHADTYYAKSATSRMAGEIAEAVDELLADAGAGEAARLTVRRAAVTVASEAGDHGDDSFGQLGQVSGDLLRAYVGAPWRAAGLQPEVFWADLLDLICLDPYAMAFGQEVAILAAAGAKTDLDLALGILDRLAGDYVQARLDGSAQAAQAMRGYLTVAAGAVDYLVATAARIGSAQWMPVEAMVDLALRRRRRDLARAVLDAADQPGWHRDWVRRRRAALDVPGSR